MDDLRRASAVPASWSSRLPNSENIPPELGKRLRVLPEGRSDQGKRLV